MVKSGNLFVIGLVALVAGAPAYGRSTDTSNTTFIISGGMTIQEVAALMQRKSMQATATDGGGLVAQGWGYEFDVTGYNCNGANRCTEFLFSFGFDLPNGFPLDKINQWNASQPAGRAFLDEDDDPFLDHTISVSGPEDEGAFYEGLLLWLNALEDFDEFLNKNQLGV